MKTDELADSSSPGVSDAIQNNLEKVSRFEERQHSKRSFVQRGIERISIIFGQPTFMIGFIGFCVGWIVVDMQWHALGHPYFDEPPFVLLQGCIAFIGVLITMAVLIRQNRLAQVEESRAHLELQVNLLAEQKTTKIIMLLEELRRDMPGVSDRHDAQAQTLQTMTNPDAVLEEIENRKNSTVEPETKA